MKIGKAWSVIYSSQNIRALAAAWWCRVRVLSIDLVIIMSLLKYLKHKDGLQDPRGPLSTTL